MSRKKRTDNLNLTDDEQQEQEGALDVELDFDLDDFNLTGIFEEDQRIMKPRIKESQISHCVAFENAREFARKIDLRDGSRTFAWINGNFIFGDVLEALLTTRKIIPKNVYIASLSVSQENIDSFETCLRHPDMEHMYMLLSGYFYSHEKFGLIPYLYEKRMWRTKRRWRSGTTT